MKNNIGKAKWILLNEGPVSLAQKGLKRVSSKFTSSDKLNSSVPEAYNYLANPLFAITDNDILQSNNATKSNLNSITTALWFVPYFDHITFGGIYTIFRFMEHVAKQNVKTYIVIYDNKYLDVEQTKKEITKNFPGLASAELINLDLEKTRIQDLPASDIAFATIWMSAYLLLKYNQTKRKYYFIQDYEPLFYEGGSIYALAESTYRLGFTGIVNTPGLFEAVNKRHGLKGINFVPAVDEKYYYSQPGTTNKNKKLRIFFYARPNNPRNAFELGVLIIQELIKKYGDKIEIVTAGSNWDESKYGLEGLIANKGLLNSLEEVGDLYRSCDVGFVYMLSKHPSYQPFEFMASGMATVTNNNEDNLWFFKNGQNCLVAEPSASSMTEKISELIEDDELRERISLAGRKSVNFDWQPELEKIWGYISKK